VLFGQAANVLYVLAALLHHLLQALASPLHVLATLLHHLLQAHARPLRRHENASMNESQKVIRDEVLGVPRQSGIFEL
jgi:hypothetical protein